MGKSPESLSIMTETQGIKTGLAVPLFEMEAGRELTVSLHQPQGDIVEIVRDMCLGSSSRIHKVGLWE